MTAAESRLYFAFGSNLYVPRMVGRVPSARFVAVAQLPDFALAFRKHGGDGSSKCDLVPAEADLAWGVVYRIARAEQYRLDAAEGPGYRVAPVTVATADGPLEAFTYLARPRWLTEDPPYTWYRDLVVLGARDHGLPPEYVAAIDRVEAVVDPAVPEPGPAAPGHLAPSG